MKHLRQAWSQSSPFRIVLIAVVVYTILRLLVQGLYVTGALALNEEGFEIPVDLQVYLDAATNFQQRQDLYLKESLESIEYQYPYPPSFAMVLGPFLRLPPLATAILHTLLHVVVYGLLYILWGRIFHRPGLRHLLRPARQAGCTLPRLSLDLAFALYLGAFIWLDIVWELALGIAVFTYLLATWEGRGGKIRVWVLFLPYALLDFWRLASYALFGPDVILPGQYVLTDPTLYLPLILVVILAFSARLIRRLWAVPGHHAQVGGA